MAVRTHKGNATLSNSLGSLHIGTVSLMKVYLKDSGSGMEYSHLMLRSGSDTQHTCTRTERNCSYYYYTGTYVK